MSNDVAVAILEQLGGNRFIAMTGVTNLAYSSTNNTLSMKLPRNKSKANRLVVKLNPDDTYTMRFYRYTAPRLNHKTYTWSPEKVTDIRICEHVYCESLQPLFTSVTGLYTHL